MRPNVPNNDRAEPTGAELRPPMAERQHEDEAARHDSVRDGARFKVRLPGFVSGPDVGLGDVVKRATTYLGVRACGSCERRAAVLNRWATFTGRRG